MHTGFTFPDALPFDFLQKMAALVATSKTQKAAIESKALKLAELTAALNIWWQGTDLSTATVIGSASLHLPVESSSGSQTGKVSIVVHKPAEGLGYSPHSNDFQAPAAIQAVPTSVQPAAWIRSLPVPNMTGTSISVSMASGLY
jgi:hypothetical protein